MAEYKLVLPAMGEGVIEATITGWVKNEGDFIKEDDAVLEIATDKVDSDVPTPISGKLIKKLKQENEVAKIGEVLALLEVEDGAIETPIQETEEEEEIAEPKAITTKEPIIEEIIAPITNIQNTQTTLENAGFLSPLVKAICKEENISQQEIASIKGTGLEGRITKEDIKLYVTNRSTPTTTQSVTIDTSPQIQPKKVAVSASNEIIEMDRMRKLIAEHMVNSKRVSPHVTSFIESDVTAVVNWRNANKDTFMAREGEKLTFMPIFIWAIAKAIKDFPMINVSVDGNSIIKKKNVNIGMATALPSGNLIVPVIKNADQLNIAGLAKVINDLANRARNNQLKPHEIQGGTYTVTNLGSFGNIMGTPIINQPEVAILAVGAIQKKPAVIETPQGDLIGIRHKMYMSHAYDHRVVDGALGGMFLQRVSQYLENFNLSTEV